MASLRHTYFAFVYSIALIASLVEHASAEVKPHGLIASGMVLQQGKPANIWGTADATETVTVAFCDRTVTTKADAMGRWSVQVEPQQPGGPFTMTIAGNNTITLRDVYVGDVWVASGQSNMGWPLATRVGAKELLGTENRSIRLFNVSTKLDDAVEDQVGGEWQACGPDSLLGFSAMAYYFGREIQATQQIPIGLIHASYGGSGIQQWTSAEAKLKGTPAPTPPRGRNATPVTKSRLYNGMIAPLTPFSIRGVIWYQGEANVAQVNDYFDMFSAMIRGWRQAWGQPEMPFLFVQLAPHHKLVDQSVIVSSPAVKHPVAVRYGWADYPTGNLFTDVGLPASPFRTDDWPVGE